MKEYFSRILYEVKKDTAVETAVFSVRGELVFSSGDDTLAKTFLKAGLKTLIKGDTVLEKNGLSFFRLVLKGKQYFVLVGLGGETGLGYARLIKKLLESSLDYEPDESINSFQLLLNGKLSKAQVQRLSLAYPEQAKENYYCVILSCPQKQATALLEYLKTLCQPSDIICPLDASGLAFLKTWDDSGEYQSAADFAYMLSGSITEELGITPLISIGGSCKGFDTFSDAYLNAINALRLGKLLDPSNKIFYYKDYVLVRPFEDLSKQELREFLSQSTENMNKEIFADEEIMHTAEQFLQNSLNISETARLLYLHRNTLIYRLDKLEKETGLNIRRFADAMAFRSLRIIMKLLKA